VSTKQIELYNLLRDHFHAEINTRCDKYTIDVTLPDYRIGIEYDSWFYHGDQEDRDRKRVEALNANGWSVLSIKTKSELPSIEQLLIEINNINQDKHTYREIIMDGWGVGKTFFTILKERSAS
jgi:very-short-patch-repair endonuclease